MIGPRRFFPSTSSLLALEAVDRLGSASAAAEELSAEGISVTVADARFAKPLDRDMILQLAADHEALITIEEEINARNSALAQQDHDEEGDIVDLT